ncbi:MAG: hypothetical protein U0794_20870 [Isosphaeraceae bacterium]
MEDHRSAPLVLPVDSHEALVEGIRQGRYRVSVRFDPRSLGLFDSLGTRVATSLMILSPAFIALAFSVCAGLTSQPALLVAIPLALLDSRIATGRLGLPQLLHWLPWWLASFPLAGFAPSLARALFLISPWFLLSQFLGSAGKGMVHLEVLAAVERSEVLFRSLLERGTIALLDIPARTWYGKPIAYASEAEMRQLSD